MMFEYYFTPNASKEIGRLPTKYRKQVFDDIEKLCEFSHPMQSRNVLKLHGEYDKPTFRMRSGDYRIIFRIQEKLIIIGSVRNRQKGY